MFRHKNLPPSGGKVLRFSFLSGPSPFQGEGGPKGRMRVRFRRGLARRVVAPHIKKWSRIGTAGG